MKRNNRKGRCTCPLRVTPRVPARGRRATHGWLILPTGLDQAISLAADDVGSRTVHLSDVLEYVGRRDQDHFADAVLRYLGMNAVKQWDAGDDVAFVVDDVRLNPVGLFGEERSYKLTFKAGR